MEFKKGDLRLFEEKTESGVFKKVLSKFMEIKNKAKLEIEETKALVRIIVYAVKSYTKNREFDLDKKDIKFIQGQSADVVKNLLMVTISLIPIPIPVVPFLIIFGKKIGIDILPKEHEIPEKGKMLVWPSWLIHGVELGRSQEKEYRISIAFNVMLKGSVNIPTKRIIF